MAFSQALATVLEDGKGIFIELKGDALKIYPDAKRVIVFNDGEMIRVVKANERTDVKHGNWVQMIDKNIILN